MTRAQILKMPAAVRLLVAVEQLCAETAALDHQDERYGLRVAAAARRVAMDASVPLLGLVEAHARKAFACRAARRALLPVANQRKENREPTRF